MRAAHSGGPDDEEHLRHRDRLLPLKSLRGSLSTSALIPGAAGKYLALGTAAGNQMWQTPAREGARRQRLGPPRIYLKNDAIVAHTGGLAFSVSPLKPNAPASD